MPSRPDLSLLDRFALSVSPRWAVGRLQARIVADRLKRHYEAASYSPRTSNWARDYRDANLTLRSASRELRNHARDLLRNNGHAKRGRMVVSGAVVGSGIIPDTKDVTAKALWKAWAQSKQCESDSRMHFAGMLYQCMNAIYSDGEVFLRRRWRRVSDGLAVPMQVQVLEADYLNTAMNELQIKNDGQKGPIVQGIEFDKLGRRAAYWMWTKHPGSGQSVEPPTRVDASEVIHVFDAERPGQDRGTSWLSAAIVDMKDLDEFEDAELMRQKIAACFAAFVTDTDGSGTAIGTTQNPGSPNDDTIDQLEPGMVHYLQPDKQITFGNPPTVADSKLREATLRRVSTGIGITYEDFTGDYSQVNYSSARMARLSMQANVSHWQNDMMIPLVCQGVWDWMCEAAQYAGLLDESAPIPSCDWTAPGLPILEPDKEAMGNMRRVRSGMATPAQIVREQGQNWEDFLAEAKQNFADLDAAGLVLDIDPRKTTQTGQEQASETAINSPPPPAPPGGKDGPPSKGS